VILWVDGAHDPRENMRRDALLLAAAERGAGPVLRLFGFQPWGLTLGYGQVPERELDLERCRRDGIPWARRPTGGRAIFHAQEWTYSLAAPLAHPEWGGSLRDSYRRMGALLAASLHRLGVPAALAGDPRREAPEAAALPGGPAPPCFATTSRDEVALGGRKLIGSAQRRTGAALLQQGSLLLGDGHLRLADYLRVPAERRAALRAELARLAAHAAAWLGGHPPLDRWADALEAELGPGVRRLAGEEGLFLLTLEKPGSYTAASLQAEQ
jgi:lipoate-protein ligase A